MIDLTGKAVLITGGSRGIGAAAARLFAQAGASVAITYLSRKADAERVVAEIQDGGKGTRRAVAIQADLSQSTANSRVIAEATKAFGRLDFFVANAGIWPPEPIALAE